MLFVDYDFIVFFLLYNIFYVPTLIKGNHENFRCFLGATPRFFLSVMLTITGNNRYQIIFSIDLYM